MSNNLFSTLSRRRSVIWGLLLLCYPLGLLLLINSSWKLRWKISLTVALVPLFLWELIILTPLRMNFGGAGPQEISFEYFDPAKHEQALLQSSELPPTVDNNPPSDFTLVSEDDWPAFRGLFRDGIVRSSQFAMPWDKLRGPKVHWTRPVGGGLGSFAITGDLIYTLEQRKDQEAVVCYQLRTGDLHWIHSYKAHFDELLGGPGPRTTPTIRDGRVYTIGATGTLLCLSALTGKEIWKRDILKDANAPNLQWAVSASPLIVDNLVFTVPGGEQASLLAYDRNTGKIVKKLGKASAGYSSPVVATLLGIQQLLVFDAAGLSSYQPKSGQLLWHYPWETTQNINVAQPLVVDDEHLFISSGYGVGGALIRLTKKQTEGLENTVAASYEPTLVWKNRRLRLKFSSAVIKDHFIYGLDENILTCLDAKTGKRQWKAGRYGYGQIVLMDSYLLIQCENGDLAIVRANPEEHQEIDRVTALDNKTWNHPALSQGFLLIRNDRKMMCFDLRQAR